MLFFTREIWLYGVDYATSPGIMIITVKTVESSFISEHEKHQSGNT